jgi:acyl-ACP thioesterase
VNNAIFLDYLEVVLDKSIESGSALKQLMVQYLNEVTAGPSSATAGKSRVDEGYQLYIASDDSINAVGHLLIV